MKNQKQNDRLEGTDILSEEKEFLRQNLVKLRAEHPGKYLLIQRNRVLGAFETYDVGVNFGVDHATDGPFLVRNVMNPEDQVADVPKLSLGVPLSCQS